MDKSRFFLSYTGTLIFINVIFFVGTLIFMNFIKGMDAVSLIALMPATVLAGQNLWTFLTSMFMHAGFGHLLVNMISLMFIGNFVEKLIGKKRFIALYFAGGIFAGIFFVVIAAIMKPENFVCPAVLGGVESIPGYCMYAVGASGAIFALGGLLAVLTPRLPVLVFFIIPMPMWAAMGVLMFGIWALSLGLGLPIGNTAHLGGLIVGLGYGFYLKNKFPRKTKMISKYFAR